MQFYHCSSNSRTFGSTMQMTIKSTTFLQTTGHNAQNSVQQIVTNHSSILII